MGWKKNQTKLIPDPVVWYIKRWEKSRQVCTKFGTIMMIGKGKSPEVPFHGITLPYSYFEVIWIFAPIQQEAKHDQKKLSAEQKLKVCWQSPAMFCLFTNQAKIQICCTVKLISWNIVNLCHLWSEKIPQFFFSHHFSIWHRKMLM